MQQKRDWQRLAADGLLYWHLCSLDAPTIAVVWASLLARGAGVPLHTTDLLVLGLGAWIIYVLDRILDGAGAGTIPTLLAARGALLQERHHFHRRHRKLFLALCCLAALVVAARCCRLDPPLLLAYLTLGLPVSAYGVGVHHRLLWPGNARLPPGEPGQAKEAAVALLFTAAVAAPSLVQARPANRPALLTGACLLALLCWVNCLLISYAEQTATRAYRRRLPLSPTLRVTGLAVIAAAALVSSIRHGAVHRTGGFLAPRLATTAAAILLSSLLLLALTVVVLTGALNPRRLRVLADLGMLTPLLFLAVRF